ncbi:MAG: hypothetical protein ACYDHO_01800 [Gaiellaceae bacterium]
MDANRTNPWLAAIAVAALVLALAALLVALSQGPGMMGGNGYRDNYGPGMMGGDRGDYGPGMMGGDRGDFGPGMMGRGDVYPSPGR